MTSFNLWKFVISRFSAALGDQFMMFAVPLLILKTTGSVAFSGIAFAIEWLPRLLFLPVSGSIADRVNVQKLYVLADGGRVVLVAISAVMLNLNPEATFWILSVMMAALAILNSLAFVAMEATLPRQMSAEEMPKAQSILQGADQASQIIGPALAAIAVSFVSLQWIIASAALFFFASFLNAVTLPKIEIETADRSLGLHLIRESYETALKVIADNKILLQLSAMTWLLNLMYGSMLVLAPAITLQTFAKGESSFGALQTASAVIGIALFFVIPQLVKKIGLPKLGALSFGVVTLGAFVAGSTSHFAIFVLGAVLLLCSDGMFNVYIRSLRAVIIPKQHFGKTTGLIILLNNGSLPLSGMIIAHFSKSYAPQEILLGIATTVLIIAAITIWFGRQVFGYRTLMPSLTPTT